MVICLERGADLHMAQLMPLPLTISCFCKIQIGFTFLVPAHLGSHGKGAVKRACVCVLQPIRMVPSIVGSLLRIFLDSTTLPSLPLPLEVGPLIAARESGERCKLPDQGVLGEVPAEI